MKAMIAALVMIGSLVGCAVHTRDGSVIVDPHGLDRGGFCPPGQAKKGNC